MASLSLAIPGNNAAEVLSLDLTEVRRGSALVLGPIRLRLKRGETLAILGPSGIGKSTLLRVVAGLSRDYAGNLSVTPRTAIVFQEPRLLPWRTLAQNLMLASDIDLPEAELWLERAGLGGRGRDFPGELSLGQARRVAIVRAFATRPDLLLLDEPFASLDPETALRMMELFEGLRDETGVATLFVTHVDAEAERLASRIARLQGAPAVLTEA